MWSRKVTAILIFLLITGERPAAMQTGSAGLSDSWICVVTLLAAVALHTAVLHTQLTSWCASRTDSQCTVIPARWPHPAPRRLTRLKTTRSLKLRLTETQFSASDLNIIIQYVRNIIVRLLWAREFLDRCVH